MGSQFAFQQDTVISDICHLHVKHLCDLEYFFFFRSIHTENLCEQNLFHMNRYICQINDFDHFDHTVQLLFDLFKCYVITGNADGHTGNRLVLCRANGQTLQIV